MIENEMTVSVPLEVVKASEIEPKEVKWLWYPYIPVGKVTLLQGDPGDGKSKLMLSIAALLSKGEPLPFTETEENEPMTIIYQTTEDDADDTVVPRFNSAGGNGENLIFIKEDEKSLSFGDNRIREAIEMYHAKLLILAALGMMAVMLPLFFLAMYEKDGQPLEVVAKHFYEAKFKRPKTRPYKTKNYYALLVQQADVEMEVNRIVQNSRKADSEE